VSCNAADQSIVAASVQQHFGTKALEEFEKTELGKLDINDLNELSQQLKERGKIIPSRRRRCPAATFLLKRD
jgi:ribosomal protein S18